MTQWEQVKVSDLEEGDTVRFAGLEWKTLSDPIAMKRVRRFYTPGNPNSINDICVNAVLPFEAEVERKVEPKTKEFLVTCEWRKPESKHEYVVLLSGLSGGTELHTANYNWDQRCWVVIKVEEQT